MSSGTAQDLGRFEAQEAHWTRGAQGCAQAGQGDPSIPWERTDGGLEPRNPRTAQSGVGERSRPGLWGSSAWPDSPGSSQVQPPCLAWAQWDLGKGGQGQSWQCRPQVGWKATAFPQDESSPRSPRGSSPVMSDMLLKDLVVGERRELRHGGTLPHALLHAPWPRRVLHPLQLQPRQGSQAQGSCANQPP